jgi:hypothetical protein
MSPARPSLGCTRRVTGTRPPLARLAALACLAALPAAAAACSSGGPSPATTTAKAFDCDKVPASQVQASLGPQVSGPVSTVNGDVTTCTYSYAIGPGQVIVRVQQEAGRASYEASRDQFISHHLSVSSVSRLGNAAFASTMGSGQYQSNTIVVLSGSTLLSVAVGPGVSLLQVASFVKQLLHLV